MIGGDGSGPAELISTIGAVMAIAAGVITIELSPTTSEMFVVAFKTIVPSIPFASIVTWPPAEVLQLPPIFWFASFLTSISSFCSSRVKRLPDCGENSGSPTCR